MSGNQILVVDPVTQLSTELEGIFRPDGISVIRVPDAMKGVGLINDYGIKAVFVSLIFSFSDGLRAIRGIKLVHQDVDIVAVINQRDMEALPDVLKAGASEFLTLPLTKESVKSIINKIFEKQQLTIQYSKLLTEGLEYMDLLNLYQKCMKILVTTDMNALSELVIGVMMDTLQVKAGAIWCSFIEGEGFRRLAFRGAEFSETPDLSEEELKRVSEEGLIQKNGKLWVSIKGNGTRLLAVACLVTDKKPAEKESNFIKSISGFAGVAIDNSIRSRTYQQFILKDPLTDAYSFSYFTDYVNKELSKSKRFKRNLSIVFLKIENFGHIKGNFSEYAVNSVIKRMVELLFECVRGTDIVAKKQDDEYYVLLPETDYFGALVTARRFISAFKGKLILSEGSRTEEFSISISSGTFPRDGGTLDLLLYKINKRLESQKHSLYLKCGLEGRDFWECFEILVMPDDKLRQLLENINSDAEIEGTSRQVSITAGVLGDILETLSADVTMNAALRGAFFVKLGDYSELFYARINQRLSESGGLRIYKFDTEEREDESQLIRLIRIPPEDGERGDFFLAVTEDFSYGFFIRQKDKERMNAFHTSDPFLIENMLAKLQERYFRYREL